MRIVFAVASLSAVCSCAPAPPGNTTAVTVAAPAPPAPPPAPPISGLPATFTIKQRSQIEVPGTSGSLKLSISDITRGQVQTSVFNDKNEKEVLLQPVSFAKGDQKTIEYQKRRYELTLVELSNALVGEDFATFKLADATPAEAPATAPLSEARKIDRLIASVESLEGAKFIRNGNEYSPAEAAKHLRDKRSHAGVKLKTADEFIEQIGSRSSLTGEDYTIRYADGRVVKSGEFLRQELMKLAPKEPPPAAPSPTD
jgi:hypothetical protein